MLSEPATIATHRNRVRERILDSQGGFAFVVSGPSGVGKTSICEAVIEECPDVAPCVTTTTRPIREAEVDGVDYHFVDEGAFEEGVERGAYMEHATVNGNRYGATIDAVIEEYEHARILLVDVDVQGARTWRHLLEDCCVSLFVLPPSMEELSQRLSNRGSEGEASLKMRTERAHREMEHASDYDYVILNRRLEDAVNEVKCVLTAEGSRTERNTWTFRALGLPESDRGE